MSTMLAQFTNGRRALVAAAVLLALASMAGCRGTTPAPEAPVVSATATASPTPTVSSIITNRDADAIRDAAVINLATATSVHMKGYVTTQSGKKENIDLLLSGRDGRVVLTDDEGPLELLRIGDFLYVKGTREYWRPSGSAAVRLMDGKYLKTPTTEKHFASFNNFFDAGQFMPGQHLQKGQLVEVNGTPAIALVDPDPKRGGTLFVASQGIPYPLRIQSAAGTLRLDFSDYGQPVQITAPPSSQVVDIEELLRVV